MTAYSQVSDGRLEGSVAITTYIYEDLVPPRLIYIVV